MSGEKSKTELEYLTGIAAWRDKYRNKIPHNVIEMCQVKRCGICKVALKKIKIAKKHYHGKLHKFKIHFYMRKSYLGDREDKIKKTHVDEKDTLKGDNSCKLCNVNYNSMTVKQSHLSGEVHRKNKIRAKEESVGSFPSLFHLKSLKDSRNIKSNKI
mgnify:CR=1 FL=1